jgi:hypothetical protein
VTDPQPTPEDQAAAQSEVQNLITQVQIQTLYNALVEARAEVAALRRVLAEGGTPTA